MTYDPTWIRKSPILIPQAVQNESLTAQKGSVRLDALDWGQKVGATTVDGAKGTSTSLSLSPLNNGKMFVAWGSGTDGKFAIVDSEGNMDSTAAQVFESGNYLDYTYGLATLLLPNGNLVVAYGQDQGSNNALVFKIYSENGDLIRDAVTVKTHATETQWGVGLAALPDGSIVVTWQEAAAGAMAYFAIYDLDGDVVKGYTSLGGNYATPQPAPLSDGNWVVTYGTGGNVSFRTYDRLGIGILGETLFRSSVTQATGLRTMGNGQIVVPFVRGFGIIDRQGNVVVAPETKEAGGSYAVTVLPHDNIVAQNNNGTAAYYKIYDSAGNLLNSQVTYDTASEAIANGAVATFKNGNFMLAYVTASGANELKVFVHQGTKAGFGGDLAISGSLSLASGTSVNEISTDGTLSGDSDDVLVTEKAVKTYADNIVASSAYRIFDGDSQVAVYDDSTGTSRVDVTIDGVFIARYNSDGLTLNGGVPVTTIRNDYQMGGYDGASGSQTALTTEYAARKYIDDINFAQKEPTGFVDGNSNSASLIGIDGSNVFYIEPASTSYDVFFSGDRYRKTSREEVTISDVEGMHYVYFDYTDGVLKETTTFNINFLYTHGYVAALYWDATNKEVIYMGDERHGCTMDGKTHANIHIYRGTLYYSGLAISNITADSTSVVDADAQFSVENGLITDEDISHTIPAQSFPANLPMFYLSGTDDWRYEAADNFPVINTGSGRVAYNQLSGSTWSLTEATNGTYVLTHVFATNDPNKPVVGIVGQANYLTLEGARVGAADEINSLVRGDMPFAEFLAIATIIYETDDSYTNTPKARVVSNDEAAAWTDWRTSGLTSGTGSVNDHGNLTGLGNDDHLQYFRVDGTRAVTGNLAVNGTTTLSGTTLIAASTTISAGTLTLPNGTNINEFSTDGTLAGDSDIAVPTEKAVKTYVDAAVAGLDQTKIYEGDSYVQVVDDSTAAGYIEVVADGVQVAYWDAEATSQRFGKAAVDGGYSLTTADASAILQDSSANTLASFTTSTQYIGIDGVNKFELYDGGLTKLATLDVNNVEVMYISSGGQMRFGTSTNNFDANQATNTISIEANNVDVFNATSTTQTIGVSGDSRLVLDQTGDQVDLYAGTVNILTGTPTSQRLGASGDTALTLNTGADTFTLSAGATTMVSGTTTSISLGVSGDTSITLDSSIDQVSITAGGQSQILVETSGTTIYDDLTVTGDLFVDGTTFVVNQTEVRTADNVIVVNYGEPGAGVTAGTAGLQVDRGTLPDYYFVFAENTDTFRIGEEGETQAVATREDNPVDGNIPYWNDAEKRFDTAGDTYIFVDQTSGSYVVGANSVEALTIDENGMQLFTTGATINEFSTDGTLAGDSDQAVPTEKAVKTYVDSMIFSGGHLISQGDSKVEVYDSTGTAHVDTVVDGTLVEYLSADSQVLGVSGDTLITLNQTANTIVLTAGNTTSATFGSTGITLATGATINEFSIDGTLAGASDTAVPTEQAVKTYVDTAIANLNPDKIWQDDSYVQVHDDGTNAGWIEVVADGVQVQYWDAQASSIRMGKASAAGRIDITDSSVTANVGSVQALALYATIQWIGVSGDTFISLNQSSDAVAVNIANTTEVTVNTSGFALKTGATVNAISTSTSLGTSDTTLVTQNAVKSYTDTGDSNTLSSANSYTDSGLADATTYIDIQDASTLSTANGYTDTEIAALRNELDLINMRTITTDSTAATGDVVLVDTTAGDVTVEMMVAEDSRIIIKKKTTDGNKVNIVTSSGTIDGQNLIIIDTPYQSFTFVSDGSNFYII